MRSLLVCKGPSLNEANVNLEDVTEWFAKMGFMKSVKVSKACLWSFTKSSHSLTGTSTAESLSSSLDLAPFSRNACFGDGMRFAEASSAVSNGLGDLHGCSLGNSECDCRRRF